MSDSIIRERTSTIVWLIALIIAGLIATAAWEFYARGVSPVFFGAPVREPVGFAQMVAGLVGADQVSNLVPWPDALVKALAAHQGMELSSEAIAQFAVAGEVFRVDMAVVAHFVVGVLLMPLFFVLIFRIIFGFLPTIILGPLYGAALFVVAGYVLNTLLMGGAPFWNWSELAISSLVGHVVYGLFLAVVVRIIAGR